MTLKEFYEKKFEQCRPKMEWVEMVAAECGVTDATVWLWIKGRRTPDKLKREKIAQITGASADELFPDVRSNGKRKYVKSGKYNRK